MSMTGNDLNSAVKRDLGWVLAFVCASAGFVIEAAAQVNYSGGAYLQNFDSLPSSGSSIPWTDNSTLPGWYAWRTTPNSPPATINLDDGSQTATAYLHNYGSSNSTDRALGLLPGSTPGNVMVGLRLHNSSAVTYNSFTVTYDGEQWRVASSSPRTLTFACTTGSPANLNDSNVTWVVSGWLNFISPVLNSNGVALNGNAPSNRLAGITGAVGGITWPPGTDLWLRFTNPNQSGGNAGLALDNFVFSASTNVVPVYSNVLGNCYYEAIGSIGYVDSQLATGGSSLTVRNLPQAAYIALALNYPDPVTAVAKAQSYLNLMFTKQDTNAASGTFGHFFWDYTDTAVTDQNSVEFCFKPLSVILKRYAGRLGSNYVNSIKPMILNGLAASRARSVAPNYSNIHTMRIINWLMLGEALPDTTSRDAGLGALASWISDLGTESIHEYDSDTYSMVTYCNLLIGANNATNATAADQLRSLANFLATDLSVNYFNGQYRLGGSRSRDYDFVSGNGAVDHYYYLTGLQAKTPAFGSLSEGIYAFLNVAENGNLPPLDVLAWGSSWSNRVVKSVWGPIGTPGQDRYNFLTPDFCIGSSGAFYGSTQDKAIAADLTDSNALAQISLVYDPYDSPYADVKTPDNNGQLKPNHLKFYSANAQDKGTILSLATPAPSFTAGSNFLGPYTNVSSAIVFPSQADAIYLNGAAVAASNGNSYAATAGSVVGIQAGNGVIAARFCRVDGLDGYTPTYAVKFDGGIAARFVAYHYQGASTTFDKATNRPIVAAIIAARTCTNAAAVSNFLNEVKNAPVTLTTNGSQSTATIAIGGTSLASTLDASSGAVISRTVNGTNYAPQMFLANDAASTSHDLFSERFTRMLGSGWVWTPLSAAGGSATYNTNRATPTTTAMSYEPLTATPDAGVLVYRTFTGDAEVVTRVNQQSDTSSISLGGVALRETLDAGACGAVVGFSGAAGVRLLWRNTNSGPVSVLTNPSFTAPGWVRLRRSGNVFTAAYRSDSGNWQPVGAAQTIPMNSTAYGGLAAAGGAASSPATTVFSNAVGNSVFMPVPAAPTGFAASAIAANTLSLQWIDNATNETGFSLEVSTNAGLAWNPLSTTAAGVTSFTNSGLLAGAAYYYRLAALNGAGLSAYAYANATTWTSLQAWRQFYFGTITNSGSAADMADPDGDGLVNMLEYALGSNPLVANTNSLTPAARDANGNLTFTFFRAQSDLSYIVQGSTNLQNWTGLNTNLGVVGQDVIFTDFVTNGPRHFLRLKVTQP